MNPPQRWTVRQLTLSLVYAHIHGQSAVRAQLIASMTPQERTQVRGILTRLLHLVQEEYPS